jgi:hypothetical protein
MLYFTSPREKRLWFWAFAVFATIFSTLFIGQPLAIQLSNQNVQAVFFMLGMIMVGAAIVVHGLKTKPSKIEITILLGIIAVYIMFYLRLGIPERSHLIEYGVLAIFIHKALIERVSQGNQIRVPALVAFLVTFIIGVLDECMQIFLPTRIFDPVDIVFNGLAALMAIGASITLQWVRMKIRKN